MHETVEVDWIWWTLSIAWDPHGMNEIRKYPWVIWKDTIQSSPDTRKSNLNQGRLTDAPLLRTIILWFPLETIWFLIGWHFHQYLETIDGVLVSVILIWAPGSRTQGKRSKSKLALQGPLFSAEMKEWQLTNQSSCSIKFLIWKSLSWIVGIFRTTGALVVISV